jgi:hypothetical protein
MLPPETRTSDSLRAFASHLAAKPRHRLAYIAALLRLARSDQVADDNKPGCDADPGLQ